MKILMFIVTIAGYVLIYVGYTALGKDMPGRMLYTSASVIGTLIGSTLGTRWFDSKK